MSTSTASCRSSGRKRLRKRVIEELGLKDLPEFSRSPNIHGRVMLSAGLSDPLKSALRLASPPPVIPDDGMPRGDDRIVRQAPVGIDASTRRSSFPSASRQRTVSARPKSPTRLPTPISMRSWMHGTNSVRRASTWMEGRLAELRQQAVVSDRLVQQYKSENGIIDTNSGNGQLLSDTQLTEHSARLGEAQKDTAQKQARYDQIQQMIAPAIPMLQSWIRSPVRSSTSCASSTRRPRSRNRT